MSSRKRRNKDKCSPSSDKQSSKSNLDDQCNINNSYEKRSHEDAINHHERDGEYEAYSKNRKQQRSKERNYEKTKSRFHESYEEQYERFESGYSEISSHSKRNKESGYSEMSSHNRRNKESGYSEMSSHNRRNKDFNKVANYADGRDSQSKKYRSNDDNDDDYYHSKNKVNTISEGRSYNEKEKRSEKSDKNRHYKTKECVPDDGDSDYFSNKVRNKNLDDNSHSRKEKRYENYDHSSEDDPTSESNYRDSYSKKYLSDDDGDDRYSSSKAKAGNSKRSLYTEKYQKSDHFNDFYNRDKRRDQTDRRDNHDYSGRSGMDYRRHQEFSGERDSFFSKRDGSHNNRHTRTVAEEVNQDSRSEKSGDLKSDGAVDGETNKETNLNDAKAPKKMISGAYIPPAKLRLMQQQITDKGSIEYQKIAWEALKKSINGLTNKVNTSNIIDIVKELFKENIIRGRGVLTRALMQAQALSPTFTHVYAALVAVINTKFPEISELLLKRLILQFKRGFRRNDKQACLSSVRFIAHLLNQQVAHEVLVLEVLTLLLEHPTDHSVEVAIAMLKECGKRLEELSKRGCDAIFSRLRHVLHEGNLDKRTQYMIEVLFAVRKDKFKDYPSVVKELDLVEENDKFTHLVTLDEALNAEELLNVFKFDAEYEVNEEHYKDLVKEILGDSESEDSGDSEAEGSGSDEENDEDGESQKIIDMTESNLVALRRNIYLTIQSSLDFEECAHKLLKMELKPGEIMEMCYMILDCCAQQRTYEKFYGLLAQRFCQLNKVYMEPFMEIFRNSYETIHRLETNKLRNVAKFFAHLLYTDAIEWNVLSNIKLNENDTTSSSRIFIKILFQELSEYMGLPTLNKRVKDVTLQEAFDGLFPRDNPHNTRFAINFFTSIGLGGLTDELREHLKTAPKNPAMIQAINEKPPESSSEDSPSNDSSSSSSTKSDSEDEEPPRKKRKSHGQKTSSISKKRGKSSRSRKHKNRKQSSAEVKHKKKRRN